MTRPRRLVACFVAFCVAACASISAAQSPETSRAHLISALERLIAGGPKGHAEHDDLQWLQLAVTDAISRGDKEIERLAVRAAAAVTVQISRPVSPISELPSLDVLAQSLLQLPRPIAYTAQILASFDSGEFVKIHDLGLRPGQSPTDGLRVGERIDRLHAAAATPGLHFIRLKARLRFRSAAASDASWAEERDLPPVAYAVYDDASVAPASLAARAMVYAPALVSARVFDQDLPEQPFASWLANLVAAHRAKPDEKIYWRTQYCSERTAEAGMRPDVSAVCAIVDFGVIGHIGNIWFRTAEIHRDGDGVKWTPVSPPVFEGFTLTEVAQESQRLSKLPGLIEADRRLKPMGDVSINPDDIVILPAGSQSGAPLSAKITVRNQGTGDLFKVLVYVSAVTRPEARGTTRQFVLDLPAQQSATIDLEIGFPEGYGVVLAHALQISEHSPFDNWTPDPTPEDACAFRVFNLKAAPPRYIESLGADGCNGK